MPARSPAKNSIVGSENEYSRNVISRLKSTVPTAIPMRKSMRYRACLRLSSLKWFIVYISSS